MEEEEACKLSCTAIRTIIRLRPASLIPCMQERSEEKRKKDQVRGPNSVEENKARAQAVAIELVSACNREEIHSREIGRLFFLLLRFRKGIKL